MGHELLTHTSMQTARTCLRRYHYRYGLGLAREKTFKALRMGSAVHAGLALWSANDIDFVETAIAGYDIEPPWADSHEWKVEREIVARLLEGYAWYYVEDPLGYVAIEQAFQMPLINPETGGESRTFRLAGKRDGIVKWDGRLFVLERKTCGEDIGPDSDYWLRLRIDPQISLYAISARHDGHDVGGVLYDVLRKPTIAPRQIPMLDEDGLKIVVDEEATGMRVSNKNGSPRQSGGPGMKMLSRTETPEEFGLRLAEDIQARPEHYFQRREIPLLDDHLAEFQEEVWQQGQMMLHCRNRGLWFKSVSRTTCGYCDYADLCMQSIAVDDGTIPAGYVRLDDTHPELNEEGD